MKAISGCIYRHGEDCSNGGISSRFDQILLEHEDGWIDIDESNPPENLCKIVHCGNYTYAEPIAAVDEGNIGWMYGGCLVESSDARFHELTKGIPARLHDRQETQELYDLLSR